MNTVYICTGIYCRRNVGLWAFVLFCVFGNEVYARDTSRKIRETLKNKGENGGIFCVRPIFGYKKDPDNKNHWLIDDEAAEVIRFIYDCCTKENMGKAKGRRRELRRCY